MKNGNMEGSSAPERVVKQIMASLESGEMKPGDKLPSQDKLGDIYQVGRSSVREATNALAIMGYLEIIQGRGTFISEQLPAASTEQPQLEPLFSGGDLQSLVELRDLLEINIVKKAANCASQSALDHLNVATTELEESMTNIALFIPADMKFHLALAEAAGNKVMGGIIRMLHNEINSKLPVAFTTSREEFIKKAIDSARCVCHHVNKAEGLEAARAMRNHLAFTNEVLKNQNS